METGGKFFGRRQSSVKTDEIGHTRERRSGGGGVGGGSQERRSGDTLRTVSCQSHSRRDNLEVFHTHLEFKGYCLWVILKWQENPAGQSQ